MDITAKVKSLSEANVKHMNSFLGIAKYIGGYKYLGKPLLFITGTNPFDKYYGFTVFTELMLQINETYSSKYTIIFFPNPASCPLEQLSTYKTLLSAGIHIYPPTLSTPPLSVLMQAPDSYFGGWWDPIYFTVPTKNVLLFTGDPSVLSEGTSDILGDNFFPDSVAQITPIIPTSEEDWWKPWRIGVVAAAVAVALIALLFITFCFVCKEKHNNESGYILEDAPEMGNTTGSVV